MALVSVDHKRLNTAFFFQALFSAIILALAFYLDQWIDELIDKNKHGKNHKHYKLLAHVGVMFVITFIVIYLMKFIFGWGNTFLG